MLIAWFPSFSGYPVFADEYQFISNLQHGLGNYFANHIAREGVWRLVGQIIQGTTPNYPVFSSFLAVLSHIITVCLFFRVSQLLLKKTGLSLVLALCMGIFPWGYQVMMQYMCYTMLLTTLIFWANLLLLISFCEKRAAQMPLFFLTYLLTLLAQLNYENLAFAFMVSGVILWIDEDMGKMRWKSISQNILRRWSGLGPLLGSLTYLVLYKITLTETIQMKPGLNLESILSVCFYQYTNYYIFQPWFSSDTRNLIFIWLGWEQSPNFYPVAEYLAPYLSYFSPTDSCGTKTVELGQRVTSLHPSFAPGSFFRLCSCGRIPIRYAEKICLNSPDAPPVWLDLAYFY